MYVKLIYINQSNVSKLLISARLIVSVIPRHIVIHLNYCGCPNIEPKFFGARFAKRPVILTIVGALHIHSSTQ